MYSVVFIVVCIISLVHASCPTYVPVPYYGGACGSSEIIFSPLIAIDTCYVVPSSCPSGCDRQCCNQTTWEYCTACAACTPSTTASFIVSEGKLLLHYTTTDCTGVSVQLTGGCTVILNVCESANSDYTVVTEASKCVDNSTTTGTTGATASSSGVGATGATGTTGGPAGTIGTGGIVAGGTTSTTGSSPGNSGGDARKQTSEASILSMIFL